MGSQRGGQVAAPPELRGAMTTGTAPTSASPVCGGCARLDAVATTLDLGLGYPHQPSDWPEDYHHGWRQRCPCSSFGHPLPESARSVRHSLRRDQFRPSASHPGAMSATCGRGSVGPVAGPDRDRA